MYYFGVEMEWRQSMQGRGEPPVSYTMAWCEAELADACAANTWGGGSM